MDVRRLVASLQVGCGFGQACDIFYAREHRPNSAIMAKYFSNIEYGSTNGTADDNEWIAMSELDLQSTSDSSDTTRVDHLHEYLT